MDVVLNPLYNEVVKRKEVTIWLKKIMQKCHRILLLKLAVKRM